VADVSIIVTAYNIEDYVEQCLQSVADQTLRDIEVLVVDDGSTDSTQERIVDFCDRDPRFIPVLLPDNSPGGVATAANAGLDRATAPWVGFVDGDDYVAPTMFERLVDAAAGCEADLAMCGYQEVVDGSGKRQDPADAHRWAELTASCYELDIHTRRQFLRFIAVPWRKLYRRTMLEENRIRFPISDGFYEDNPFHWFTVLSAGSLAVVPDVLCYHRIGRAGQTMAAADERLLQIFGHHDTIHTWLTGRRLLDVYETTLLGWVISQMEWIARRTPPPLRRALFDTLQPIFARYSRDAVRSALREGNKGASAQRMSAAVAKGDYRSFVRTLAGRPSSTSLVLRAAYHLRHSGLPHTALLSGRYLRNVLRGGRVSRAVSRILRAGRGSPRQDVMFGLTVIQQRLRGQERLLGEMEARLGDIEDQLVDLKHRVTASSDGPTPGPRALLRQEPVPLTSSVSGTRAARASDPGMTPTHPRSDDNTRSTPGDAEQGRADNARPSAGGRERSA
jgi:glycosyltransferase involved in cell wall biosynthesis